MMTIGQATYHAQRAGQAAYTASFYSPESIPITAVMRQDSAYFSAHLAFAAKLREHGFDPGEVEEPDYHTDGTKTAHERLSAYCRSHSR